MMNLKEVAEEMRVQNNRGTHLPIFVVVEDQKEYGIDDGWADGKERKEIDHIDTTNLCDKCTAAYEKDGDFPEECGECPSETFVNYRIVKDVPNMRAAFFFTAKSCDAHIAANRHHYDKTAHSYAISACFNWEIEAVINHLKSL